MVAYTEHPESASYSWEYRSGCYDNGEIAVYETATIGSEYSFTYVPIEVREDESLYNKMSNVESEITSGISPIFGTLSLISMLLALVCGLLFAFFYFK